MNKRNWNTVKIATWLLIAAFVGWPLMPRISWQDSLHREEIERLLQDAESARQQGMLFEPEGTSALASYIKVLSLAPNNARASQGVYQIVEQLLDDARKNPNSIHAAIRIMSKVDLPASEGIKLRARAIQQQYAEAADNLLKNRSYENVQKAENFVDWIFKLDVGLRIDDKRAMGRIESRRGYSFLRVDVPSSGTAIQDLGGASRVEIWMPDNGVRAFGENGRRYANGFNRVDSTTITFSSADGLPKKVYLTEAYR